MRKRRTQNSKRKTLGERRRPQGVPLQSGMPFLKPHATKVLSVAFCVLSFCNISCKRDDMADQPRGKPLAESSFFPDQSASRTPPRHTVTRTGQLFDTQPLWATTLPADARAPFSLTAADLHRGQQQFTIFCTPCHGQLGDGNGMIPDRGFLRPPTYHSDRLRNAPDSYFFNVITNGIGAMYPYNDKVAPDDRWRITAYIRALQLSQHAPPAVAGGDRQ